MWRDTSLKARFFIMDIFAAIPLVIMLLHVEWWTFYMAITVTTFLGVIEHFGFSIPVIWRMARSSLAGRVRSSKPWWKRADPRA